MFQPLFVVGSIGAAVWGVVSLQERQKRENRERQGQEEVSQH